MTVHDFNLAGVQRHRLKNGLRILLRRDPGIPIVATTLWYRAGSRYETQGITGISHFLEHMMFKGTERFGKGAIDVLTSRHGGSNNAFTSLDYTAYYFSFAADRWEVALDIESDRMCHLQFDAKEFELERQVILEELKMELDSPWGALRYAVETQAFRRHPYRFPVIGLREDLLSLQRDQMVEYYRRFYTPANAVLVVVGDFDPDQTLRRIESLFSAIPPGSPVQRAVEGEPERKGSVRLEIPRPGQVPRLLLAFPAPCVAQREQYAMQLLDNLLSEGKLSRLYRALVEREQVASFVTTEYWHTLDPYLLFLRVELLEGEDPQRAEALVYEELQRLAEFSVEEGELQRAKNQALSQLLAELETPLDQALHLGLLVALGQEQYWDEYVSYIERVSPEELAEVAAHYLSPERAVVGVMAESGRAAEGMQ